MPIVLFGKEFWDDVLHLEALAKWGTISIEDLDLFLRTDSVDEAYDYITTQLGEMLASGEIPELELPDESASEPEPAVD